MTKEPLEFFATRIPRKLKKRLQKVANAGKFAGFKQQATHAKIIEAGLEATK